MLRIAGLWSIAAMAALIGNAQAEPFPACSTLPPPVPPKVCPIIGTHQVCVSSVRCTAPNTPVVVRQCYKWSCSAGAPQSSGSNKRQL